MDCGEDESVLLVEYLQAFSHLPPDLVGRPEGQGLLRIDAAAPEDDSAAVLVDEALRVHSRGGSLDGIEHVEAGIYETLDERLAAAAAVFHGFPFRTGVNPVVELFAIGQVKFPIRIGAAEQRVLGGKVRTIEPDHMHPVADGLVNPRQVLYRDLGLSGENFLYIFPARNGADVPFFDITNSLRMFEKSSRHQGDITESRPGKARCNRKVGIVVKLASVLLINFQILLADESWASVPTEAPICRPAGTGGCRRQAPARY